jgi:phosphoribosylanthranilate isomerase
MVHVKICGITSLEDAQLAVDAGADALGFVFYPPSPRYVTPEQAEQIIQTLPPFVTTVGLFVDVALDTINDTAHTVGSTVFSCMGVKRRNTVVRSSDR